MTALEFSMHVLFFLKDQILEETLLWSMIKQVLKTCMLSVP